MPYPTLVTAAVIRDGDTVLIARRLPDDPFPLLWEFPGGKTEPGELPEAALARECFEELGIRVEVGGLFDAIYHRYDRLAVVLLFFECKIRTGAPDPLGCGEVRYAPVQNLPDYDFLPADRPVIVRLRRTPVR
jgi:8-oxo-dGTP diphosphatase